MTGGTTTSTYMRFVYVFPEPIGTVILTTPLPPGRTRRFPWAPLAANGSRPT